MAESELSRLLGAMRSVEASDLFITEGKPPAMRVQGTLRPTARPPTTRAEIEELLAGTSEGQQRRFALEGDLDCGLALPDGRRFRLNFSRQQGRLAVVARSIPSGEVDLATLGLPPTVGTLADQLRGLVLVTGATGSGKSTTMAAFVNRINSTRNAHVVTLEDPIEFVHRDKLSRVSQREVGGDTTDFNTALRHVLRQSPDVIVLGELRDSVTMQVALQAALTGHLVLATLHTVDATQTLQRIMSSFPEHLRAQVAIDLSLALRGVVSQRLLPTTDGKSRVLACEMLTVTPPVERLLREQRVEELVDLMRGSRDPGQRTFNSSILDLFRKGAITFEIGRAYATNPDEFALQAEGMAVGSDTFAATGGAHGDLDMRSLLELVVDRGASDLHLTAGRPPILRVVGRLVPIGERPLSDGDMRMLLFSVLSGRQRSLYELEREIDFALSLDNGKRFRVNAYYQRGRMAASLRAIPSTVPDPVSLGLPHAVLGLAEKPQGLLLVCGPTGSGKSTTLACLVDRINHSRNCRIITVEDPIEYVHEGQRAYVDQREVAADTGSFAAALKYVLRQDPDVILVGEMRDLETIGAALTAAETGHLVLATLHTNDAIQAIDRVIDVFPAHQQPQVRSQLAGALLAVVSQRLLPRIDQPGRIAAFEVLVANPAMRTLIREGKMHQAISTLEASRKDGMVTMDRALSDLYGEGKIALEEAMRFARNPKTITG